MTDWKDEYDKMIVNEQLETRYKHLSPEAQQAIAPALLAEQQNKPTNPWRRKGRESIPVTREDAYAQY